MVQKRTPKNTSFSVGDHFSRFIEAQVTAGRYSSASDVVRASLRLLEEQESKLAALRAALAEGEKSGVSGRDVQDIWATVKDRSQRTNRSLSLSCKADADIEAIAEASLRQWGLAVAERYSLGLHETFTMLAGFPDLGRDASNVRRGHRKIETASHSVFYRKVQQDVLIVRVLHQHMDSERHL